MTPALVGGRADQLIAAGIMVPVLHDGAVHVDGGVMNNLPGDIMRRRAGLVITVDVTVART